MANRILAAGLVLTLVLGGLFWLSATTPATATATPDGSTTRANAENEGTIHPGSSNAGEEPAALQETDKPPREPSPAEAEIIARYTRSDARSMADARWLQQHGFPEDGAVDRYFMMSDAVLASMAARGDELAQVLLAQRQLTAGESDDAKDKLYRAAANGSNFALEQMALAHMQRQNPDPIQAQGYFEASRLLGNHSAPRLAAPDMRTSQLTLQQQQASALFGQAVVNRLNQMRASRGLPKMLPSPRPNEAEAFDAVMQEELELARLSPNRE